MKNSFPGAFCERLTAELTDAGWERFHFDRGDLAFTRELGKGFQAVVQVTGSRGSRPGPPLSARLATGVGYGPATALMPRLTLDPAPLLVETGVTDNLGAPGPRHELGSEQALAAFGTVVVELARERAVDLARPYAGLAAMEEALRAQVEPRPRLAMRTLPVFLAATARPDEALRLVEDYLAADPEEAADRAYRRFARQLRLWIDAGAPPPPVLASWPADAFELGLRPRRSFGEIRTRARARREAQDAVRRVARGKSRGELVALLTAEYARRGVDAMPAAVMMQAGVLELEREPLGQVRSRFAALKMLATLTRDSVSQLRQVGHEGPAWLEPRRRTRSSRCLLPIRGTR